jgi:hypothetical protein
MPDHPIPAALLAAATILAGILAGLVLTLVPHLDPGRAATPPPSTPTTSTPATPGSLPPGPGEYIPTPAGPPTPTPTTAAAYQDSVMSPPGAPIVAGLLPTRGALVGIAALIALAVLDRIPLRAYRPRPDRARDRIPRHRPARPDPTVTLTRLDQPAAPALPPRARRHPESPQPIDTGEGR